MANTQFLETIQDLLPQVENLMRLQAEGHHSELAAALNHLLASGGKRIRPAVTLLAGRLLGAPSDRLVILAAAIELLHTATLVHDDLIDGSLLRRGIPTLNAQWSPAATVLTGDFIFARAAKLAANTQSVEVMSLFAETLAIIVNGEITQLFASRGLASREDYFQRIRAKTAALFELATGAAAILSPASDEQRKALCQFGYEIGMAFQIVDDILDFTGEQATVGKPVASDLRQGLITLPALYYYESHPGDEDFQALLNGRRYNEEAILRVVSAIRQSGAIEKSMADARTFVENARMILMSAPAGPELEPLGELADYIVARQL